MKRWDICGHLPKPFLITTLDEVLAEPFFKFQQRNAETEKEEKKPENPPLELPKLKAA